MKCYCLIVFLFGVMTLQGQQDPQYTQYMYNMAVLNPAYAGSDEGISLGLLYRNQWTGFDGAPETATLFGHSKLGGHLGLGLSLIADELGPVKETNLYADIAYQLKLDDTHHLGLGFKVGATFHDIGLNNLTVFDPNDPFFSENVNSTTPNLGAGAFLYSDSYYLGVSIPNLLESVHLNANGSQLGTERQHLFITGGYVFELTKTLKLKPSFLVKSAFNASTSFDINLNALFYEKLELGASYRYDDSVSALVNFAITIDLKIGYAYDAITSRLRPFAPSSHEIFVTYRFLTKPKDRRIKSPRFF
ncbi:type IX secretion system membrane protein PorP/SprF [Winogradskyella maritima]|uniref:Type IX secretion system membrane protein PorP/SprF n=1 Tax=Winogradskyella maritima TaxID=1517766 RepID=A0ABV8AF55_9FLAO|nr:type IX secretion system membrane protein PorP/SprF [Winogradskyella maritima]